MEPRPLYISVDVETDGAIPGIYSMLSFGACIADEPERSIYRELAPISEEFNLEALKVNKLDRDQLITEGTNPTTAMSELAVWVADEVKRRSEKTTLPYTPVFVGLNAAFDWQFINWYFITFLSRNPFGHKPLDINALFMGVTKCGWENANARTMSKRYYILNTDKHHALADCKFQAQIFCKLLAEIENAAP